MIKLNIHEAKTYLSRDRQHLSMGETIILCKRDEPMAEIRPLPQSRTTPRPIGLAKSLFKVPPKFFEPLDEADLAAFEGNEG